MRLSILAITMLTALLPAAVMAQDSVFLEEIVVTSQRREQNLQEVPISVTAFTGDALKQANITEAQQYLQLTPNVAFTDGFSVGKRGLGIGIRGINNMVTDENTFVNSVGVYLDEFSVAAVPTGVANPQLQDLERIEILRGPQGTFFGRNALGGALNLTTKKPNDQLEGYVTAGAQSFDGDGEAYDVEGMFNWPILDNLFLRTVAYYEDSDGRVENVTPGGNDSDSTYEMLRGAVRWEVSDRVTVDLMAMYTNEEQGADENVPSGVWDIDTVDTFGLNNGTNFSSPINPDGIGFWDSNRNKRSSDLDEENNNKARVGIGKVSWSIGDIDMAWISGIIDTDNDRLFDNDLVGGADLIFRQNEQSGTSWSSELRMDYQKDAWGLIAGILYADDDLERQNGVTVGCCADTPLGQFGPDPGGISLLPAIPPGTVLAGSFKRFELTSIAVFADFTWHATDQLDVIVGGRYTDDEVTNTLEQPITGDPGGDNTEDFDDFSPRFVLQYQINDDVGVYGSVSKGYKAGGTGLYNDFATPGNPIVATPFDEEELWTYETGIKSEWFDQRLRVNASVFYNDWSDLQLESFRFLVPGDLGTNIEEVLSVDDANSKGFEVEMDAAITERFTVSAGLGYTDSEVDCSCNFTIKGGFDVQLDGLDLPRAPEWTFNTVGEYRLPLGSNEAWFRAEVVYRDEQTTDVEGMTWKQTQGQPLPNGIVSGSNTVMPVNTDGYPLVAKDYTVVNFRAGFLLGESWEFTAFLQNAFDEKYYTGTQEDFGLSGFRLRPNPRIYGAQATFSF